MRTLVKSNRQNYPASNLLFDDFFGRDFFNFPTVERKPVASVPAVNIKETENAFIIEAAIPGVNKEDVKVELNENILSIFSESKKEEHEQNKKYTRQEFSYASFKRSFTIDEDIVDTNGIEAKFENGVLVVTISKKETKELELKKKTISVG